MSSFSHLEQVEYNPNRILTVGTFDGVHGGHQVLIRTIVTMAAESGLRSAVVTFDPHPRDIIHPGSRGIHLLTTLQERSERLFELGVDDMIVIPFDRDFSLMSSEDFIRNLLWEKIGMSSYVIGYDHQFGRDRAGTIDSVKKMSVELGFSVRVVSRQEIGEHTVSSSKIRKLLEEEGRCRLAARLLGTFYRFDARVVRGDGRGKTLGFPTANLMAENERKVIPANGVYAVQVHIDEEWIGGMMNIGIRPTFDGKERTMEVHLFDFDKMIYGRHVQVRFLERVRDEMRFNSVSDIQTQLFKDKEYVKDVIRTHHKNNP
ncbi:MAG: bifunctional riboflavin kinase/FAD synthetase [Balneolaceae bacterium]